MDEHTKNITPAKCVTVFVFALFSLCSLLAFIYFSYEVSKSLLLKEALIEFNKGAMYILGVGLGSGLLVIFMIHELTGREISHSYNKKATRFAVMSLVLMFMFPVVADYIVSSKINRMGYVFCDTKSYQWLHVKNKVYGADVDMCNR